MEITFSRNGKWITVNGITVRRSFSMNGKSVSITPQVVDAIAKYSPSELNTESRIKEVLFKEQKKINCERFKKSQNLRLGQIQKAGFTDFFLLDTGFHSQIEVVHDNKTIFVGGEIKIPYTPKAWDKIKSLKQLSTLFFYLTPLPSYAWPGEKQERQKQVAEQEKILMDWVCSTPKPILLKK